MASEEKIINNIYMYVYAENIKQGNIINAALPEIVSGRAFTLLLKRNALIKASRKAMSAMHIPYRWHVNMNFCET